jgi:hypothetical protein
MKSKDYKSLEEVCEMKKDVWEDFQKSGFSSYVDFIESEMIEIRKKYDFIYNIERHEKEKQLTTAE